MTTKGHIVALQAQLDDVGEALGPDSLKAADGYHGTAVRSLLTSLGASETRVALLRASELQLCKDLNEARRLAAALEGRAPLGDKELAAFASGLLHECARIGTRATFDEREVDCLEFDRGRAAELITARDARLLAEALRPFESLAAWGDWFCDSYPESETKDIDAFTRRLRAALEQARKAPNAASGESSDA